MQVSLVSVLSTSMSFLIQFSHIAIAANTFVWNTNPALHCEIHDNWVDDQHLQSFQNFLAIVHQHASSTLIMHRISSVFVPRPIGISCQQQSLSILIESYHDSLEVREAIKKFASLIKEQSNHDICITLRVYELGQPFLTKHGQYIIQNQIMVNHAESLTIVNRLPCSDEQNHIIRESSIRWKIHVIRTFVQDNRVFIVMIPKATPSHTRNFEQEITFRLQLVPHFLVPTLNSLVNMN